MTAHIARAAALAAKFQDARRTLRAFWGDEYDAKIAPARDTIRAVMSRTGEDVLPAALRVASYWTSAGNDAGVLATLAAAVDLCEAQPSTTGKT